MKIFSKIIPVTKAMFIVFYIAAHGHLFKNPV